MHVLHSGLNKRIVFHPTYTYHKPSFAAFDIVDSRSESVVSVVSDTFFISLSVSRMSHEFNPEWFQRYRRYESGKSLRRFSPDLTCFVILLDSTGAIKCPGACPVSHTSVHDCMRSTTKKVTTRSGSYTTFFWRIVRRSCAVMLKRLTFTVSGNGRIPA